MRGTRKSKAKLEATLRALIDAAQHTHPEETKRVDELVQTYVEFNLREHDRFAKAYPGVDTIVRDLRAAGMPLGLVTSKRRRGGEMGLRSLGLADAFDVEIYGDEVDRPKPDPDPVRRALRGLGLDASERVTFVGDAIHDVEAGQAALEVHRGTAERTATLIGRLLRAAPAR